MTVAQTNERVFLVTGSNTGIGFSIAEQLLSLHDNVTVVLACRNAGKANAARDTLATKYCGKKSSGRSVEVLVCDLSDSFSVLAAAAEFRQRFSRLDALVLNAGMMPVLGLSVLASIRVFLTSPAGVVTKTGDTIIQRRGDLTKDGLDLGEVFAANFFGHFALVRELEDLLAQTSELLKLESKDSVGSRVVWMTSTTAEEKYFDADDYMCLKGTNPYESSKRLIEIVHMDLAPALAARGIRCVLANPGAAATDVVQGHAPIWAMIMFLYIIRFCGIAGINITPFNGAKSSVFLAAEAKDAADLDPKIVIMSDVTVWGKRRVKRLALNMDGVRVCNGDVCSTGIDPKELRERADALLQRVRTLAQNSNDAGQKEKDTLRGRTTMRGK
ncbi:hypothetical protein HDU81_008561 [Chytriomyces hyalinus]|nr:hypothetical protein HDU81_008561 [Chytriomyces hyalinus]